MTIAVAALVGCSLAGLAGWLALLLARGWCWRTDVRLSGVCAADRSGDCPSLAVVMPDRNEANLLPRTLSSLLAHKVPRITTHIPG